MFCYRSLDDENSVHGYFRNAHIYNLTGTIRGSTRTTRLDKQSRNNKIISRAQADSNSGYVGAPQVWLEERCRARAWSHPPRCSSPSAFPYTHLPHFKTPQESSKFSAFQITLYILLLTLRGGCFVTDELNLSADLLFWILTCDLWLKKHILSKYW